MATGLLLNIVVSSLSAKELWLDAGYRDLSYPKEEFYTAYYWLANEQNDVQNCIDKTILSVRSMLANSIFSDVSSVSKSNVSSINNNGIYTETESFINEFTAAASAKLVNVNVVHTFDDATNSAYAYAYIKKSDLSDFCESKINSDIASAETQIALIKKMTSEGYKAQARDLMAEAELRLKETPVYLSQLIAVGRSVKQPSEYASAIDQINSKLALLKADLGHVITIFVNSSLESEYVKSNFIPGKCKSKLSANGCSFMDSPTEADFVVDLNCSTRTSSNTPAGWFAFADIDIKVTRNRDAAVIYEDSFSVKGGGVSEMQAHRKSLDSSVSKICDNIIECFK